MHNTAGADPDLLICNAVGLRRLTQLMVNAGLLRFIVNVGAEVQSDATIGQRATHYINPVTGRAIEIILDRYCPMDTFVVGSLTLPFPIADLDAGMKIWTNKEYHSRDFATTQSQTSFANYVMETLSVYYLGGLGVLRGCVPSL